LILIDFREPLSERRLSIVLKAFNSVDVGQTGAATLAAIGKIKWMKYILNKTTKNKNLLFAYIDMYFDDEWLIGEKIVVDNDAEYKSGAKTRESIVNGFLK